MTTAQEPTRSAIIGRSSSHFTRVVRIFAAELGVDHSFEIVADLLASEPASFGGNPALRIPILRTSTDVWFGALSICRELARRSGLGRRIIWPEQLDRPLLANVQELAVQAMSTEVTLIMARPGGAGVDGAYQTKMRKSLLNTMSWLDTHLPDVLATLPSTRDLSYLEVSLFCLTTHLDFREILSTADYANLTAFCEGFGRRPSASATPYRFDAV